MTAHYFAEITVWDPAAGGGSGAAVTKYYGTRGFATASTDTPAKTHIDERLKQPLQINRTMFAPNATRGRSIVGTGDIVLVNGDGSLDDFGDSYSVDGRTVKVYKGTIGAAYPSGWTKIFEGTMQGVEVTQEFVSLKIRDALSFLNVPLQTTKYTGGGLGTLEGTEDTLKGKPKPICYGKVRNVAPPFVEAPKLIAQVSDGLVNSIDAVYDRGVQLKPTYPPMLVAVGISGKIQTSSDDGVTWDERTNPDGTNLDAVAYARGIWVAGGVAGSLITSEDGINWTSRTSGFGSSKITDIDFLVDRFFAAGEDGKIATSTDGETWTRLAALPFSSSPPELQSLIYGNGVYLTCFDDEILYSPDGINWESTTISGKTFQTLTYGNGVFVAAGNASAVPIIYTSTDGVNWTSRTVPASHTIGGYRGAAYGDGVYCLVGVGPIIATSTDGTTWTARTSAASGTLNDVQWDGAQFVCVAGATTSDGEIQTSPTGATWTEQTPDVAHGMNNVAIGEGGSTVATYASSTDLLDNALQPAAGKFKAYYSASGSYFRLGASPSGLITADVTQGANDAARTTAQIWKTILDERAGMASGDWNATDVTDLDSANNDVIGFWTDQEARVGDVIDAVKDSAGAASFVDGGGIFRIKQFLAPTGSAVLSITANDLIRPLRRILPAEQGQGIPQYRTILRYQKNYTPQTTDVAASVSDARKAFLAKEWREATDTDTGVQTVHFLAIESVEETLLDSASDAATEADRRQTLRGTQRQLFELWLQYNDDTDSLELNDVIELTHSRYGLSGGESFRIVGHNLNVERRELCLTVWG